MERKRRLDSRIVFIVLYVLAFLIYIIYGLQPVGAAIEYEVSSNLNIPSIGLETGVTELHLKDGELEVPDSIAGSYTEEANTTLLVGHSTTVFTDLNRIRLRDTISYDGKDYHVTNIDYLNKADVDMDAILEGSDAERLVIMTCAGELLVNHDATHRLIVTAVKN